MATQNIPEPASLKTWDQAFQYPLPTVRKLSTRLRRDIDDHRSRLRSLVGASYRDLLSTAERIIDMDKQVQSVEYGLSDIGRRCNSSILEKGDNNYTRLERAWSHRNGEDTLRSTAQCKILASALDVVSRLIRREGDALQAAKLMVLARLLYKGLTEMPVLERYRRTISTLRNKLLAYINSKLAREETSSDELTSSLSAYALLTNSTPKLVLSHLLSVRLAQLEELAHQSTKDSILQALRLYTSTFVSVQIIFPRRLADMLTTLSKIALLSDKQIKSVEELNLDIYGRWIAADVRAFMPWVQQDTLTAQDGRQAMSDYSRQARKNVLEGLKRCLSQITSINTVLDVRKQVLGASLSIGTKVRMDGYLDHFEETRQVFLERLEELVHDAAKVQSFRPILSTTRSQLWNVAENDIDLSSGGSHFCTSILRQVNGHDAGFDHVVLPLREWRSRVEDIWTSIEAIRATKWDEYLEIDLEDDEEVAPFQEMLSNEDSRQIQQRLHTEVEHAVQQSYSTLTDAIEGKDSSTSLLRVLRELNDQQSAVYKHIALPSTALSYRDDLSRNLHAQLAAKISGCGIEALKTAYSKRHFIPVELWEGSPKMPTQPLPATFRYIMTVQREMADIGMDLWSPAAVTALKLAIRVRLAEITIQQTEPEVNGHPNGVSSGYNNPELHDTAQKTSVDQVVGASSAEQADADLERSIGQQEDAEAEAGQSTTTSTAEAGQSTTAYTTEAGQSTTASTAKAGQNTTTHTGEVLQGHSNTTSLENLHHIQRLFDATYLYRVFNSAESTFDKSINTLKDRAGLDSSSQQRLEKNAVDYWKKTYLLFGLLAARNKSRPGYSHT